MGGDDFSIAQKQRSSYPSGLVQMREDDSEDEDEDDEMQIFLNKFNLHPTPNQKLSQTKSKWEEGLYHMGDLQEHKYQNP